MRAQDGPRRDVIRQVETEVAVARSQPGFEGEVDDELYRQVIGSYVKKMDKARQEYLEIGERGAAMADKLGYEVDYLSRWLPQQARRGSDAGPGQDDDRRSGCRRRREGCRTGDRPADEGARQGPRRGTGEPSGPGGVWPPVEGPRLRANAGHAVDGCLRRPRLVVRSQVGRVSGDRASAEVGGSGPALAAASI